MEHFMERNVGNFDYCVQKCLVKNLTLLDQDMQNIDELVLTLCSIHALSNDMKEKLDLF